MNLMHNQAFRADVAHALASHNFELTEDGRIYVPGAKAFMGGVFSHDVNGRDARVDHNLLPDAALIDILSVYFKSATQRTAFYIAPFSGSGSPGAATSAANFASTLTEFSGYNEAGRVAWTPPTGALGAASIDNSAAVATFTISAAGSTVNGFGMLTTEPKSDTTGLCVAAAKLADARTGMVAGDELNVKYAFTAADAG